MPQSNKIKVTSQKKNSIIEFSDFNSFLEFYYTNIATKDSVSWTDFVYNNYIKGNSKRDINGYTIEGANELLQEEIFNYYQEKNCDVQKKGEGFNIGCKICKEDTCEYVKTPSSGVNGKYNWLNELFIYKLFEKLDYGPKVYFDLPEKNPLVLIRAEDIKNKEDKYIEFDRNEHKSIGFKQNIKKEELVNAGAAEVLVGLVLLLDDLHYKEGTNYSFIETSSGKKLKIFDLMCQNYKQEDFKPVNQTFSYSKQKNMFYTKRNPYYAVSGSFIHEDLRNLAIDLGIEYIEKNKEKFKLAIKEAEEHVLNILDQIKSKNVDIKIIDNLYNKKAFNEFLRNIKSNLANIENFHSNSIAIKPSAALITSNYQDEAEYGKNIQVIFNGKNDSKKVEEQKKLWNLYSLKQKKKTTDQ